MAEGVLVTEAEGGAGIEGTGETGISLQGRRKEEEEEGADVLGRRRSEKSEEDGDVREARGRRNLQKQEK